MTTGQKLRKVREVLLYKKYAFPLAANQKVPFFLRWILYYLLFVTLFIIFLVLFYHISHRTFFLPQVIKHQHELAVRSSSRHSCTLFSTLFSSHFTCFKMHINLHSIKLFLHWFFFINPSYSILFISASPPQSALISLYLTLFMIYPSIPLVLLTRALIYLKLKYN